MNSRPNKIKNYNNKKNLFIISLNIYGLLIIYLIIFVFNKFKFIDAI